MDCNRETGVINMDVYKSMYLEFSRTVENVMRELGQAQIDAENIYLDAEDSEEDGNIIKFSDYLQADFFDEDERKEESRV